MGIGRGESQVIVDLLKKKESISLNKSSYSYLRIIPKLQLNDRNEELGTTKKKIFQGK